MAGPGGLKVGDLYVSVTASIGQAVKTLGEFVDAAEEFADQVEEKLSKAAASLGDISDGFLTAAAVATGSLLAAKDVNQQVRDAVDEVTRATQTLANELAKDLVPLVKEVVRWLKTAIATYRNLSAEQRQLIVDGVKWAFILGTTGKALERTIVFTKGFFEASVALIQIGKPVASSLAAMGSAGKAMLPTFEKIGWHFAYLRQASLGQVFSDIGAKMRGLGDSAKALPGALANFGTSFLSILGQLKAIALPVLAIAAAVGALVVLVAVLRDAWDKAGEDIKAWFADLGDGALRVAGDIGNAIGKVFESLSAFFLKGAEVAFEFLAAQVRWLARMAKPVARLVGARDIEKMLETLSQASGKKMLEYVKDGARVAWDYAALIAEKSSEIAGNIGSKAKDAAVSAGKVAADIGKTFTDSVSNGLSLLKKDLGLETLFEGLEFTFPKIGDPNSVTLMQTLDEAEEYEKWLKELAKLQDEAAAESKKEYMDAVKAEARNAAAMFKEIADESEAIAKELAERMREARDALASKFFSRLGELGSIAESGMQGFQAGGVWGAIIAVVVDLLTRAEGFKEIIDMTNNVLKLATDALGKFFTPLKPLVAALLQIDLMVSQFLGPVLEKIGQLLGNFAPILILLGEVLAPILALLGSALEAVVQVLSWLVDKVLWIVFNVLKTLGLILLGIVWGVGEIWNGILDVIAGIMWEIGKIIPGLQKASKELDKARIDTSGIMDSMDALNDLTWEGAKAKAEEIAKSYEMQQALDQATESLTNVPSTWRVALARFEAQDPRNAPGAGNVPGNKGGQSSSAPAVQNTVVHEAPAIVIGNVTFSNTPAEDNARELERLAERIAVRNRGTAGRGAGANVDERSWVP